MAPHVIEERVEREQREPRPAEPVNTGLGGVKVHAGMTAAVALAAVALAAAIVVWAAVNLSALGPGFAVLDASSKLQGSAEATSALARLFAALVLGLFLAEDAGWRMRWVAGGLAILGLGHLVFGYLEPTIQNDPIELNESLYEAFVTETFACALFAVGLFPGTPGRLLRWTAIVVPGLLVVGYVVVFEFQGGDHWMPSLARVDEPEGTLEFGSPLDWLTPLHWVLWALPLGLAAAAVVGAFWQSRRGLLRGWLLFAMVLLAGSLLHEYLWPSPYGGEILTTADILSLAFAMVVALGGITELRRVAVERAALLASERERTRRLGELAALKADFSAMVAHELDGPISAIRKLNELISAGGSTPGVRDYATGTIEDELDALNALVRDVRDAAAIERDDFAVEPRPLPLATLLAEAEAHASTLPGGHPVKTTFAGTLEGSERIWADPYRVGQVLKNLLSNAAKYSPDGAPVELRASRKNGRISIEVIDRGPGIHPQDVVRIFDKFGRGRDREGHKVAGLGLGLYLSRRIVRGHGSELTVSTTPGEGSVFAFDLEEAR